MSFDDSLEFHTLPDNDEFLLDSCDNEENNSNQSTDVHSHTEPPKVVFSYIFNSDFGFPSTFVPPPENRLTVKQLDVRLINDDGDIFNVELMCNISESLSTAIKTYVEKFKLNFGNCVLVAHKTNRTKTRIISSRLLSWFSSVGNIKHDELLCIEKNNSRNSFIKSESPTGVSALVRQLSGDMYYTSLPINNEDEFCLSIQKTLKKLTKNQSYWKCYRHSFSCLHGKKHECTKEDDFADMDCMKFMEEYDYYWNGSGLSSGVLVFIEMELTFNTSSITIDDSKKKISC